VVRLQSVEHYTSRELERLQADYGAAWQIWWVPRAVGGFTWCARRCADGTLLNCDSPEELSEEIGAADAEAAGR
jgi:hypothetical protein